MEITPLQFLSGFFSLILSVISIYVGLYIASKYRKHNNKILLYIGLAWIGLMNGFWPSGINFILALIIGTTMSEVPYFIIGNSFLPVWFFIWMIGVTELLYKEKQKPIMIFTLIFCFAYDFVLFYYIFTDPSKIGELQGPFDVKYIGLMAIFLIALLILILITGILFARESLKSESKESRIRGYFILYAFISYFVGTVLDGSIDLNVISLPIVRIILITSNIASFIGFIMPKSIKKIFLNPE